MSIFSIGDLVKLKQDYESKIGFGFVAEIKDDLSDIKEYQFFNLKKDRNIDKLHILVYWTLRKMVSEYNGYIWMYPSQISVVKKIILDEEKA